MSENTTQTTESVPTLYCANHPDRETVLRCNRCNKPICNQCAILTPTGYRCRECVRGQQKTFDTAQGIDYPLAFAIAAVLGYFGSLIASVLGFFTIFIAPVAGVIIAEVIRWVVRRHRSKTLFQVSTGAAVLGSLPLLFGYGLNIVALLAGGVGIGRGFLTFLPALYQVVYIALMASTLYYRLAGIRMG
jgi:hypothetical protein